MNRQEYMRQLEVALSRIAKAEREDVLEYYNEYFDEAGPEKEQEVIASLGSPQKLASQIKAQCAVRNMQGEQPPTVKKGVSAIWMIVLGIFAAPIALPLAIAAAAVVFSLVITALCVLLAIVIAAVAIFVAGIITVGLGFATLFTTPITSMFYIGVGLALMGATLLGGVLAVMATAAFFRLLARLLGRGLSKKNNRKEELDYE